MKKFLHILTAVIYLVLTTGLIFNAHYCHGELERISLGPEESWCCCESEGNMADCCKNEQIFLHLDDELLVNSVITFEPADYVEFERPSEYVCSSCCAEKLNYVYSDHSPPPKQAIWKTNCSFLFYG